MILKNKVILIISPQPWNHLFISKQHYAIELARRGNDVYFLYRGNNFNGQVELLPSGIDNLTLIKYNQIISKKIKFHFRFLYNIFLKFVVKTMLKKLNKKIDIVWSFDLSEFANLDWFNSEIKIFHPVDKTKSKEQFKIAKTADLILSVSENILDQYKDITVPKYFINHGLSSYFYNDKALELNTEVKNAQRLKFAYIGNLTMHCIDHRSLLEIINKHCQIDFHFYGKSDLGKIKNQEIIDFIKEINNLPNARLLGRQHPKKLSESLKYYDGFLICYLSKLDENEGSNSHKILEYLSYGKVIISSTISQYEKYDNLIVMSKNKDNSDFVELFSSAIINIDSLNSKKFAQERIDLAMDNTYFKQIGRIEKIIENLSI